MKDGLNDKLVDKLACYMCMLASSHDDDLRFRKLMFFHDEGARKHSLFIFPPLNGSLVAIHEYNVFNHGTFNSMSKMHHHAMCSLIRGSKAYDLQYGYLRCMIVFMEHELGNMTSEGENAHHVDMYIFGREHPAKSLFV